MNIQIFDIMKKVATIAAALMLLTGAAAFAQGFPGGGPGRGGRGGMNPGMMMGGAAMMRQQPETNPELIAAYTEYMAEKLKLTDEQHQKFADLNKQYTGKVLFPIPYDMKEKFRKDQDPADGRGRRRGRGTDETVAAADSAAQEMLRNFRNMENMTEAQRQEMMQKMQERMEEAQAKADEMDELQDEYNDALKAILDKNQTKAYRRELRREEEREERRMQGEMRRRMQQRGGFGGPGGGFGGPR